MKGGVIRLLVLMLLIAIIVAIAVGSFALAYWSGSPSQEITGSDAAVVDNSENATTKYLVFEPIGFEEEYCFEYTDANGWVLKEEYGADYSFEDGEHEAGSRNVASSSAVTSVSDSCTAVCVVGYYGALGQYEDLVIPSTIVWKVSAQTTKTLNVTKINIKLSEYETPMNLITGVVIPASITNIDGVSFSGAQNLTKVYFDSTTLPTIGAQCFCEITPTYYKKSGDNYITTTIR